MKNKNIILIIPTQKLSQRNKWFIGALYHEPLSLEYLSASLESRGYKVTILAGLIKEKTLLKKIKKLRPIAIGFSVYTFMLNACLLLAEKAKNQISKMQIGTKIIFGGYHPSAFPEEVIKENSVDFIIKGEGDASLCQLIEALDNSTDYSHIHGLYFKNGSGIIHNLAPKRIECLDSLPLAKKIPKLFVKRNVVLNLSPIPRKIQKNRTMTVYSRGCPFACSFCCSKNTWGKKIFWRSPKAVLDEIEGLYSNQNVNMIGFLDLTLNADPQKLIELCDEFIKRDLPVYWGGMFRLDLFTEELIMKLALAKCIKMSIGIESLIGKIANNIKDNFQAEINKQNHILETIHNSGIINRAFLIIGFPDETKQTLEHYAQEVKNLKVDELRITFATPFPGTSFWEECISRDLIPKPIPWDKFTTIEPIIKHPHIANEELYYYRWKIIDSFYFSGQYEDHVKSKLRMFPRYKKPYLEYFYFLNKIGAFKKSQKKFKKLLKTIRIS